MFFKLNAYNESIRYYCCNLLCEFIYIYLLFFIKRQYPFTQIMSLKHIKYPIRGVQFHPESVLTPYGKAIIKNWVETL